MISHAEDLSTAFGVNGAVAKLVWSGQPPSKVNCTGTLISRIHVLTAGHCLDGHAPEAFQIIFSQDESERFEEIDRHIWDARGPAAWDPSSDGGGKDVAIITLDRPVPPSIVENIPRVHTGNVDTFLRNNRKSNFIIVGYGRYEGNTPF